MCHLQDRIRGQEPRYWDLRSVKKLMYTPRCPLKPPQMLARRPIVDWKIERMVETTHLQLSQNHMFWNQPVPVGIRGIFCPTATT